MWICATSLFTKTRFWAKMTENCLEWRSGSFATTTRPAELSLLSNVRTFICARCAWVSVLGYGLMSARSFTLTILYFRLFAYARAVFCYSVYHIHLRQNDVLTPAANMFSIILSSAPCCMVGFRQMRRRKLVTICGCRVVDIADDIFCCFCFRTSNGVSRLMDTWIRRGCWQI